MRPRSRLSSQSGLPSQAPSQAPSQDGQYPSQSVFPDRRGSSQYASASGYLPPKTRGDSGIFGPNSRPDSGQQSTMSPAEIFDRPPSMPFRKQTPLTLRPSPNDNRPQSTPSQLQNTQDNMPSTQPIPSWDQQFQPRPSHPHSVHRQAPVNPDPVQKTRLYQSKARNGQAPNVKTTAKRMPGRLEQDVSGSIVNPPQHRTRQVKGLKRMADELSTPVPAKRGRGATGSTVAPQSIGSSQQQAPVTSAANEYVQGDGPTSRESAGRKSREALRQLNPNISSQQYGQDSLPAERSTWKPNKVGQHKATRNSIIQHTTQVDDLLHPDSQKTAKPNLRSRKSSPVVTHETTPSPPEPEPPTPHHRPRSREELVENVVNQSQEISVSQETRANLQFHGNMNKQQNYADAGAQSSSLLALSHPNSNTPDSPKQPQQKSSKEAYARVNHHAEKMVEFCLNPSEPPSFGKQMTTLKGIDEMAKTQLQPAEAADIRWDGIYGLMRLERRGLLAFEELEKSLLP